MKEIYRSTDDARVKRLYRIILYCSAALISIITIYGVYASVVHDVSIIGEPLVNLTGKPLEIPTPEIFPIYAKPVTWLYISILAGWFALLELKRERAIRMSSFTLSFSKILSFVVMMISAYEILYNFSVWSALMSYQATIGDIKPDALINKDPNPRYPWNLVFATKIFTSLTAVCAYSLYYIHKVERVKERLMQES